MGLSLGELTLPSTMTSVGQSRISEDTPFKDNNALWGAVSNFSMAWPLILTYSFQLAVHQAQLSLPLC